MSNEINWLERAGRQLAAWTDAAVERVASLIMRLEDVFRRKWRLDYQTERGGYRLWSVFVLVVSVAFLLAVLFSLVRAFGGPKNWTDVRDIALFVGGSIALSFAGWRTVSASRQADTAESGQVTERFTKAVEQLAARTPSGEPNYTLRMGGIYALGRIAKDSPSDAQTVFDVLSSYVQTEAPRTPPPEGPYPEPEWDELGKPPLRQDLAAVMAVCRTVTPLVEVKVDFSGADLTQADLSGARLHQGRFIRTTLIEATLNGTSFAQAQFDYAFLSSASGDNCDFSDACLYRAVIRESRFHSGNFLSADLCMVDACESEFWDADFIGTKLHNAGFNGADCHNANFAGANLSQVNLTGANLYDANFSEASARGTVFRRANLEKANVHDCDLYHSDLEQVQGWETVVGKASAKNIDKIKNEP